MSIKDKASVSGIGETRYLRGSPSSAVELQLEASLLAAADAGIAPHEIDGV
ncbi:MAG: transporter, partial [Betaproteobacteria bacterium]|nr:transporter [Betaproteobacteria bacterium]